MTELDDQPYRELPAAMVNYFAARMVRISKHAGGHRGQKAKAKARRRGVHGKAVRRRELGVRGETVRARARQVSLVLYDETRSCEACHMPRVADIHSQCPNGAPNGRYMK